MKFFIKVDEFGMIRGIYDQQQLNQNYPQIEVDDIYLDYFKNRFFEFGYADGKLIESSNQDFQNYKLKQIIQTQQTMLSNAIKSQAETQLQFNAAIKMNSSFMQQLADLQVQIKKLQEAK